jgi:hypothetical protein
MQPIYAEVDISQLSKMGEELCGDQVEVVRTPQSTIIVLSDGLGSGVKANILATMTTRIAASMLKRGIPLSEVVDTIAKTLPVCKQRKIAYSTLQILKIPTDGGGTTVIEFDCPGSFLVRNRQVVPFPTQDKMIGGKLSKVGQFILTENDFLVAVSDGVIHAGIGGLLRLGWGWQGVAEYLTDYLHERSPANITAAAIGKALINACEGYYLGKPGDDTTIVVIKMRYPHELVLFTGPPACSSDDYKVVQRFLNVSGKKVIAGGMTANIFSRITGQPLTVDLNSYDLSVPPIGHIPGVDLVTEGVLTLNRVVEKLSAGQLQRGEDGATLLANLLVEADNITILAGKAVNAANQNPDFPAHIHIKSQVLTKLQQLLAAQGKHILIEWL